MLKYIFYVPILETIAFQNHAPETWRNGLTKDVSLWVRIDGERKEVGYRDSSPQLCAFNRDAKHVYL